MLFSKVLEYAKKAGINFSYRLANSKEILSKELASKHDFNFNNSWTDSREVKQNDLFICVKGAQNDGHNFIATAIESGASLIFANKDNIEKIDLLPIPILFLDNTEQDLMRIAHAKRMDFNGKVIGITGSAGKTTVKELLAQILANKGKVAKNHKNYNTQVGLSLSILNAQGSEDFWVLEAGISHEHDMDEIASTLAPDIALVLNAGLAHAEGLPRGAAYYKSKIFSYLKDDTSLAFASFDYENLPLEAKKNCINAQLFSVKDSSSPYFANYLGRSGQDTNLGSFEVKIKDSIFIVNAPFFGEYGAENVLALSSIALSCNMSIEEIQKAFSKVTLPSQRFEVHQFGDITLIDDSYNANPLSFERMLDSAFEHAKTSLNNANLARPLICIIGSMGELGNEAVMAHEELGKQVANKASAIFYKGAFQEEFEKGLALNSYTNSFSQLNSPEDFGKTLDEISLSSAVFLVKGSRVHALEKYTSIIKNHYEAKHAI